MRKTNFSKVLNKKYFKSVYAKNLEKERFLKHPKALLLRQLQDNLKGTWKLNNDLCSSRCARRDELLVKQ